MRHGSTDDARQDHARTNRLTKHCRARFWILDFHDQLFVPFVRQRHDDRLLGISLRRPSQRTRFIRSGALQRLGPSLTSDGARNGCPLLIRELDDDMKHPRSPGRRVRAAPRVVIGQSGVHIGREAHIEVGLVVLVLLYIDKSFLSSHGPGRTQTGCQAINDEMRWNPEARVQGGGNSYQRLVRSRWLFLPTLAA